MRREKIDQTLSGIVCVIAIALSVWMISANQAKAQVEMWTIPLRATLAKFAIV